MGGFCLLVKQPAKQTFSHPESQANVKGFIIRVVAPFMKRLPREKFEAVKLLFTKANFVMSSKS